MDIDLPLGERSLAITWMFSSGSQPVLALLASDGIVYLFRLDDTPPIKIKAHTITEKLNLKGSVTASPDNSLLATSVGPELKLWENSMASEFDGPSSSHTR